MRVLVTGGAGFIASHFVHSLLHNNHSVVSVDSLEYNSSTRNLPNKLDFRDFHFHHCNILDTQLLTDIAHKHSPDIFIHFAAISSVDYSEEHEELTWKVNVLGTLSVLKVARDLNSKFWFISTDEVYGSTTHQCTESSPHAPTSPYSASKSAAETLVKSFCKSNHLEYIITRSNNIYGPQQFPEKIIPKFICLFLKNEKCTIHGKGTQRRNYIYITDFISALDLILKNFTPGEEYNISSSDTLSNLAVAEHLYKSIQKQYHYPPHSSEETPPIDNAISPSEYIEFVKDRRVNDEWYNISSEKIESMGWKPKVSFADGLQKTIEWYYLYGEHWWEPSQS
ncbi:hypothetical protein HK098_005977 [Nowakowskiella sp. JEL0407]|nr:hypothetical protein HK098_005977 [Nowakowskiella sp. JEL0407]